MISGDGGEVVGSEDARLSPVLRKPVRQAELAVRLREALDARMHPQPRSTSPAKE
jgi:hypothetical protein